MTKEIFLAGTDYKIEEKKVVLVTSAIITKSFFSPQERYEQTLKTIESIREHLPTFKIILIEISNIDKEWKKKLLEKSDYFIDASLNEDIQNTNKFFIISAGEIALLIEALKHIKADVLYKLSGRYELYKKPNFDISKFNFKAEGNVYHTTLFSIPGKEFENVINILKQSLTIIFKYYTDIEHCLYELINKNNVNLIQELGCHGYRSGRCETCTEVYKA